MTETPDPQDDRRSGEDRRQSSDAVGVARRLTRELKANTEVLRRVLRRQRLLWLALSLLAILLLGIGLLYLEVRDTQQEACRNSNDVRTGLLHIADSIEAQAREPRPDGRPRTEQEIEATREFVADLRADFALLAC